MNLRIDEKQLKVKHRFEIYPNSKEYPQLEDSVYELVSILEDKDLLTNEFQAKDVHKKMETRPLGAKTVTDVLQILVKEGYVNQVDVRYNKEVYTLKTHPWVKN
jgi:hypothetical protein